MRYKIMNRKWTQKIALSILAALLVSVAGCGSSQDIRDTEVVKESVKEQDAPAEESEEEQDTPAEDIEEEQDTPAENSEKK